MEGILTTKNASERGEAGSYAWDENLVEVFALRYEVRQD